MQRRTLLQLAVPAFGSLVAPAAGAAAGVRLVMIVAPNSALQNLDFSELRRLFSGDPLADSSGRRIIPFNHPPLSPDRVIFDRAVLGMTPDQVAKYWVDRRIRGQPGPPRTATSLRMLVGVVSKLPGAIGYIRPEYVDDEVRVITISGTRPDSPNYPLLLSE
jgi:ABC-type phosphate transport system substrate-binding protein